MDVIQLKLPDDVARSLDKQAADAGMSPHDYVLQMVTQFVRVDEDADLVALVESRQDESNDIEDSPELWAQLDARIESARARQK